MLHRRDVLRQAGLGGRGERGLRHRPGHLVVPRGLDHRAAAVGHRHPNRGAKPAGQPRARRDLRQRLGERRLRAQRIPAPPPPLGPGQLSAPTGHRQISRPCARPGMRTLGPDTAPWTASCLLISSHQRQHRVVVHADLDADDLHPVQAEQQRRIVGQARGLPSILQVSATRMITERHGRFAPIKTLIYSALRPAIPPARSSSKSRYSSSRSAPARAGADRSGQR
jgi:hypothetical protein